MTKNKMTKNKMTKNKMTKNKNSATYRSLKALLLVLLSIFVIACVDDLGQLESRKDIDPTEVRFDLSDVHDDTIKTNALPVNTRAILAAQLAKEQLTTKDLIHQQLEATSSDGTKACLIESTVPGSNPIFNTTLRTRAEITTDGTFGEFMVHASRSTNPTLSQKPNWFFGIRASKDGRLIERKNWDWNRPYACFWGIFPSTKSYSKLKLSPQDHNGTPYVTFETEVDARNQKDLMTAYSGNIKYSEKGKAPIVPLSFRHALTAVSFAVGQNLDWAKTIDQIEIRKVKYKGRYLLPNNGNESQWTLEDQRTSVKLTGLSVPTSTSPNSTITGKPGDNSTFYMLPQKLTGSGATVYIHFTDGSSITAPLKGEWKAGTTKTYKISNTNSNWTYVLTTESPNPAAYNEDHTGPYKITSYRRASDGTLQPVKWRVVGYSTDEGKTWSNKYPKWVKSLSKTEGNGGTDAEKGTASLSKAEVIDLLDQRNRELHEAPARGSLNAPYDLSIHDLYGNVTPRNTANCYIISAPGVYMIPLVYGNGIKDGKENPEAYTKPSSSIYGSDDEDPEDGKSLKTFEFCDHEQGTITNPWIEKTNNGKNAGVNGVKIVWASEKGLVYFGNQSIIRKGSETFLQFEVKPTNIKNGNAVIAVMKNGTVYWSWHLWFAPKNVLDKIEVTTPQNKKYNFTTETLGWRYTKFKGTSYKVPRTVKVKVQQENTNEGKKKEAIITIVQTHYAEREGDCTLYQWGRKDAFPGYRGENNQFVYPEGHVDVKIGHSIFPSDFIKTPDRFYIWEEPERGRKPIPEVLSVWRIAYLWSKNYKQQKQPHFYHIGDDEEVVKTIYDPSPAGFKMPPTNAFSGFAKDITSDKNNPIWPKGGGIANSIEKIEEDYHKNYGLNFWTNNSHTSTIYFPCTNGRYSQSGGVDNPRSKRKYWSGYWTARGTDEKYDTYGMLMEFDVHPYDTSKLIIFRHVASAQRSSGCAVRPISE